MNKQINPFSNTAFKYGFGFFETMRAKNSKIIFFDEHINRLNSSLKIFKLNQVDKEEIREQILYEIKKKKLKDARIRISYSIQYESPLITYEVVPYVSTFQDYVKIAISSYLLNHGEELRKHKTTNYFLNYFEYQKARSKGYDEVLFFDNKGHLLEGSRTNVFLIFYKGDIKNLQIYTPDYNCGILKGIARDKLIEICNEIGFRVIERKINLKQFREAKEIFLTNSLHGIIPVRNFKKTGINKVVPILKNYFDKFFEE